MKIQQETAEFKPQTITIETRTEQDRILDILDTAITALRDRGLDRTVLDSETLQLAIDLHNAILNPNGPITAL